MKYYITHSYPEKFQTFNSEEVDWLRENFSQDWKIISFSKIKKDENININIVSGIKKCFLNNDINVFLKLKIFKEIFDKNIKNTIRNLYCYFLAMDCITFLKKDDLIYSYWLTRPTITAYFIKKLIGTEYIANGHGSDIYIYPPSKKVLDEAKFITTIAQKNKEYLTKQFKLLNEKVKVYRLGTKFKGQDITEYINRSKRLIFIGRLEKVKGIDILLESIVLLKKFLSENGYVLEIYGDGSLKRKIERKILVEKLDKVVFLKGWVDQNKLREKLSDSKGILLSSYSEGIPVTLMQALQYGTPAIANNVGGVAEVVFDGTTGLLNEVITAKGFSIKIKEFIEMEDMEKEKFSKNSFEKWNKYYRLEKNLNEKYLNLNKKETIGGG